MDKTSSHILENVRPGDILLFRSKRDRVRQTTPEGVFGYWKHSILCLEDEMGMCCAEGWIFKVYLPMLLDEENNVYALFRLRDELEEGQFPRVVDGIVDALSTEYNGFHFTFTAEELICLGYKNIGIDITQEPEWKATPLDFDKSHETVRVL